MFDGDVRLGPAFFEFPLAVVGVSLAILSAQGLVRAIALNGVAGTPKHSTFQQTLGVELTIVWAAPWRPDRHVYMRQQREEQR